MSTAATPSDRHPCTCIGQRAHQALLDLQRSLSRRIDAAAQAAYTVIGKQIDLDSPTQLQIVLFEELGMPKPAKPLDSSTNDSVLRSLFTKTGHPFLTNVLDYRDASRRKAKLDGLLLSLMLDVINN
jgi:DNA polymerase-1